MKMIFSFLQEDIRNEKHFTNFSYDDIIMRFSK
jgi:hypothetical protein